MTACSIKNGIVTVEWQRPVKASDLYDRAWATGAAAYAVHAVGPLDPTATAAIVVLQQHFAITQTQPDYKLSLGTASRCTAVLKA